MQCKVAFSRILQTDSVLWLAGTYLSQRGERERKWGICTLCVCVCNWKNYKAIVTMKFVESLIWFNPKVVHLEWCKITIESFIDIINSITGYLIYSDGNKSPSSDKIRKARVDYRKNNLVCLEWNLKELSSATWLLSRAAIVMRTNQAFSQQEGMHL